LNRVKRVLISLVLLAMLMGLLTIPFVGAAATVGLIVGEFLE